MSKTLLLAALAGTLTACTITINGSGSEGNTSANQNTGESSNSDGPVETTVYEEPTTGTPTTAAPSSSSASTGDVPTTDPSTTEPVLTGTTGETGETGTTDGDSSGDTTTATGSTGTGETTTGGGAGYGMCGWNAEKTYYACTTDSGVPGLEDPKGNYEIDCREQELASGAPCGRVGLAGCCTPVGDLYYCMDGVLVLENCGA